MSNTIDIQEYLKIQIPSRPNFIFQLKGENGERRISIPVHELSDESLREISIEWGNLLIDEARKKRYN